MLSRNSRRSPRAAAVFERAADADLDQARIEQSELGVGEALDLDRVIPAVAEVVEVGQRPNVFVSMSSKMSSSRTLRASIKSAAWSGSGSRVLQPNCFLELELTGVAVNADLIFPKSAEPKFPTLAGAAISRRRDRGLRFLAAGRAA